MDKHQFLLRFRIGIAILMVTLSLFVGGLMGAVIDLFAFCLILFSVIQYRSHKKKAST